MLYIFRKHDVRIGLYNYEYVKEGEPLHAVVREMAGTLSFSSHYEVQIQPKMARWNIHVVRHKEKTSYVLDDTHSATVCRMSEYTFDVDKEEVVKLDLRKEKKYSVEVSVYATEVIVHIQESKYSQLALYCNVTNAAISLYPTAA